jgi:hypothetical protein
MWEVIVFILTVIFWIVVWANVAAVRRSLASIERSAAILAGQVAPMVRQEPAESPAAVPLKPQSSWAVVGLGFAIAALLVMLVVGLASRTP